jgi:hypothetical protein
MNRKTKKGGAVKKPVQTRTLSDADLARIAGGGSRGNCVT